MNKIEQLEQQLAAMQHELEELKKEKPSAMLPEGGGWFLGAEDFDPECLGTDIYGSEDQNIFPDKEIAEAYADAFRVMLELRRQPGSGQLDEDGDGLVIRRDGYPIYGGSGDEIFGVCPPFPSKELAEQAGEAVGTERIKKAYATLSNIKGEGV